MSAEFGVVAQIAAWEVQAREGLKQALDFRGLSDDALAVLYEHVSYYNTSNVDWRLYDAKQFLLGAIAEQQAVRKYEADKRAREEARAVG